MDLSPTRRANTTASPTRVLSGLEELWQQHGDETQPATGFAAVLARSRQYNGIKTPDCVLQLLQQLVCNALAQPSVSAVHPDQHAGIWIPKPGGGVTLVIGNDGGVYRQDVRAGQELSVGGFGRGAQSGFQTLEPYGVSMAKDGTIYAGLQDNGDVKIAPDHSQTETLGGDGIFTAVDPNNSKIAYDTLPGGNVFVTTDGGQSWRVASPSAITNPPFYTPLAMDPLNANHITTGGRQVLDSTSGPNTAKSSNGVTIDPGTDWQAVFDLGTRESPGNASASPSGARNRREPGLGGRHPWRGRVRRLLRRLRPGARQRAVRIRDRHQRRRAHSASGGRVARAAGTSPKARGLPHRIITSVAIDPLNTRHIFVTLGSSTLRPYVPAGALGNDGVATPGRRGLRVARRRQLVRLAPGQPPEHRRRVGRVPPPPARRRQHGRRVRLDDQRLGPQADAAALRRARQGAAARPGVLARLLAGQPGPAGRRDIRARRVDIPIQRSRCRAEA